MRGLNSRSLRYLPGTETQTGRDRRERFETGIIFLIRGGIQKKSSNFDFD